MELNAAIAVPIAISIISASIAAFSAVISLRNYRREQLNQKIAAAKWKKEYFVDLLKWSDEAMLQLSEALHLCDLDPKRMGDSKFFDLRHSLKVRISAQIDRGRWFFPNVAVNEYGLHKQEGYRGYRHTVLDGLVLAYNELCRIDYSGATVNREQREGIQYAKRLFTGEIQKVLNPESRDEEFRKLVANVPPL